MKQTYDFFNAILNCEALILTGDQALWLLDEVADAVNVEFIVVNPSVDAMDILFNLQHLPESKHLVIKHNDEYSKDIISILYEGSRVSFIISEVHFDTLTLSNGIKVTKPKDTLIVKRGYAWIKNTDQLFSKLY